MANEHQDSTQLPPEEIEARASAAHEAQRAATVQAPVVQQPPPPPLVSPLPPIFAPLRQDGPTLSEWIAAGYRAENYPPEGYAVKEEKAAPEWEKAEAAKLPTLTHGNGVTETGREGSVVIRNSWLIHPDDVIKASRDRDGAIVVKTIHANYILTDEEAASIGVRVSRF